uniref:non-specific serine/threonine protein kinase n=1 Tax=Kalanchoe fedtschenkoi TaxID=63787 RepID=A0A7N0UK98_KALFE
MFKYGNYDRQNRPPSFDLYIGVGRLFTLHTGNADQEHWVEIIHVPTTNYISLCLANIGSGVPFISMLELRLLDESAYQIESSDNLGLFTRYDIGSSSPILARYNDDVYDRFWDPVGKPNAIFRNWDLISTNMTVDTRSDNSSYKPPASMLRTAAQAFNASFAIEFSQEPFIKEDIYSIIFYFAEIQELKASQKREMNILSNGSRLFGPFTLEYLVPLTVGPIKLPLVGNQLQFSISSTNESGLPPILNGCEIYQTYKLEGVATNSDDIDAIMDIKETYQVTRNWQGDPCVETSWDGLICSVESNPRITTLNLSSSGLKGSIAASIANLTSLRSIDLSYNSLTGALPDFLADLSALEALNLTGNQLSGSIPKALLDKSSNGTLLLSLAGNPNLCESGSCGKKNKTLIIAVSASLSVVFLIVVALAAWRIKKTGSLKFTSSASKESIESKTLEFTYSQVVSITDNFKTEIGEGGFGKVYLGTLKDGDKVAVKLLSSNSEQGSQEFLQEVKLLIRVHHGNLLKLVGYCNQANHMGLIYEYMPNGNLKQLLSSRNATVLRWIDRVKIAVQIAQGLDYLHNNCTPPIIHRDLKTVNILLDENLQAKIADFGLSRAFKNGDMTHISTTQTAGTPAYIDPEYVVSGKFNRKSDVYSYGVILLEIVTGQPAIIIRDGEATSILNWIKPLIDRGDIEAAVDHRLAGEYNVDAAWKIIETAFSCLEETAIQRPEISYVLDEIKQCVLVDRAHNPPTGRAMPGDRI